MKRTFIYADEKSDKFWTIEINSTSYTVTYGKKGTAGQTQTKEFADETLCKKAVDKVIAEKVKKGYVEGNGDNKSETLNKPVKTPASKNVKKINDEINDAQQTIPDNGQVNKNITLYFRSGNSDKVYYAEILPSADGLGYVVNAAWGRRGSTMQQGTKTNKPVPLNKAQAIYDKLVAEKTSKGYSTDNDGALFVDTDKANRVSGLLPQLLNVIDEEMVEQLINNDDYCAQPKHDGERRMVKETQTGVNRKGLTIVMPDHLLETLAKNVDGIADLDGEMEGDKYTVFDILALNGNNLRELPYSERLSVLKKHVKPSGALQIIETAFTANEKRALYKKLKDTNQEGIVFKLLSAPYTHGRPNSGGAQLKYKFCASATVHVVAQNEGKRSVVMGVYDANGKCVEVGSVTIPVNYDIPEQGQIIEVRYLYAYPQGSLYQPIYAGLRADMDVSDCNQSQLKYKAGTV